METTTLDTIARTLGSRMTRHSALHGLFAGAAAAVAGGAVFQVEETSAKKRKTGKCKVIHCKPGFRCVRGKCRPTDGARQPQLLPPGSRCGFSSQCSAGYICEVPVNGSNSDRSCSGGPGAICGKPTEDDDDTAPFCAVGHHCVLGNGSYACQAVPDEI